MSPGLFGALIPLVTFGPTLVTGIFSSNALQSGGYQRRVTGSKMLFQGPVSSVVFGLTLTLNLLVLYTLIDDKPVLDTIGNLILSRLPLRLDLARPVLMFAAVAAPLYWGLIRWYKKTCFLALDKEKQTYRTIDMTGIQIKVKTGFWEDIAGVCVERRSGKGSSTYIVRLKWKGSPKLMSSLGGFSKPEKAQAFAEKMSKELGLPLVAAPLSRN